MSRSTIAPRKSSPCCIGCIVGLVIIIGLFAALGIYTYRFAKENIRTVDVADKADPVLTTNPEVLMPERVGGFERLILKDSTEDLSEPYWGDIPTTGVYVADYQDDQENHVTVIAMSTDEARNQRQYNIGPLTAGRGKANAPDTGFSIRDPFSDVPQTIIVWQKPNWTFLIQTTSTIAMEFVEAFKPGSGAPEGAVAPETPTGNEGTESPESSAMTPSSDVTPASVESVPPEDSPPPPADDTPAEVPAEAAPEPATDEDVTTEGTVF